MLPQVSFKDLETRGFVVIPGFLDSEEVAALRDDFASQPVSANRNYKLKAASPAANQRVTVRVREVLAMVNEQTALKVDAPQGASYFATGRATGINFPWHQDHESFFELQNHFDYLNFYIPIVKPDVERSNLSVVPFDVLEREAPGAYRLLVRSGATRFVRIGNTRLAIADDSAKVRVLPKDMDAMAYTPKLAAGDLLLLRGDVVHRTQDAETERVALSFRASSDGTLVHRSRLAAGGLQKALMMANNPLPYQRMFKAFDVARRDALPVRELKALVETVGISEGSGRRAFMRQLLREKRRAGALTSFAINVSAIYGLTGYARVLTSVHRWRRRLGA